MPSTASPTARPDIHASMMNATWQDRNAIGLPRQHSVTTSTPDQYVYARKATLPTINILGSPIFEQGGTSSNPTVRAAGVRATEFVEQLAELGQLRPGTLPRGLRNNEIALQIQRFGAPALDIVTGVFPLNETSEPAASAIRAVRELQGLALQHADDFS
ncbi:MAG: hypothetical protein JWN72_482 [Thermoleophilia bacterium]|nr:hypothetical protein [Thermoleophilia bacterium]